MGLVRIREINENEYDVFAAVCAEAFAEKLEQFPYRGGYLDGGLLKIDSSLGRQIFGVLDDGVPAGLMELGIDDDFNCHIFTMAVKKDSRGQSFGTALIDFAVYKADTSGMEKVTAKIFPEDTKLRDWFYLHGFFMDSEGNLEIVVKNAVHTCNCHKG